MTPLLNTLPADPTARFPFRLSPSQAATVWVQDYHARWGHWPTRGKYPALGVEFSESTFVRAIHSLKARKR